MMTASLQDFSHGLPLLPLLPFVAAAGWYWFVERVSFERLGVFEVLDALRWEPDAVQARLTLRFSMTRFQWWAMKRRQRRRVMRELGLTDLAQVQTQGLGIGTGAGAVVSSACARPITLRRKRGA